MSFFDIKPAQAETLLKTGNLDGFTSLRKLGTLRTCDSICYNALHLDPSGRTEGRTRRLAAAGYWPVRGLGFASDFHDLLGSGIPSLKNVPSLNFKLPSPRLTHT